VGHAGAAQVTWRYDPPSSSLWITRHSRPMCVPPAVLCVDCGTSTRCAIRASRPPSSAAAGGGHAPGGPCVCRQRRVAIAAGRARGARLVPLAPRGGAHRAATARAIRTSPALPPSGAPVPHPTSTRVGAGSSPTPDRGPLRASTAVEHLRPTTGSGPGPVGGERPRRRRPAPKPGQVDGGARLQRKKRYTRRCAGLESLAPAVICALSSFPYTVAPPA
jgi:hypothetical protein